MTLVSRNPITQIPERVYQRLMHNSDRDEMTGCLVSRYSVGSHGYSQIGWQDEKGAKRMILGHRARWIHDVGPIVDGMTIDHRQGLCHKKCIEVSHLREISNIANARRNQGSDFLAGFCARGHSDVFRVPINRYKNGQVTVGETCGPCNANSKLESQRRRRHAARTQPS